MSSWDEANPEETYETPVYSASLVLNVGFFAHHFMVLLAHFPKLCLASPQFALHIGQQ